MQFSSMSQHAGLSLYPFRAYDANLQRWLNQDPIQEWGGINLYRAMKNNPVDWVDPYGLWLGQGVFDSVGDWELNTFNSAWNSVGNFLNDTFFKTTVQTDPNMYYGGTGTVTPITDANGNDITSDLIAEAGLMPLMALGGPEGEGEKLLAGKIACKVKPNDIKKVLALERETSSYLGVIDKSGNINLFKFGENGVLSHQDLVEQGLANQGDLGFSVGLDANGNIVVANMSGLNMPLGLGGQLPPGLYNSVKGAFGAQ
jgi:RHS repeat-associated protein